jgi:general secretion pathway protein A
MRATHKDGLSIRFAVKDSSMYHSHWGLKHSPFSGGLDRRSFFASPTHDEALARLHFLVEQRRRVGVLLGPAGTGKSLLLEVFAGEVRRRGGDAARLSLLGLGSHEFLFLLADALGLNPQPHDSLVALWRNVLERLSENRYQDLDTVLLFDDADEADEAVLEQLARLAQHNPTPAARLTLVLAASPQRIERLGRRLLGLVELRIDIQPWEAADTAEYVEGTLRRAGCERAVFEPAALVRLHELAHGIPRRVNQLADLALLAAAATEQNHIDAVTLDDVSEELGIPELCSS